MCDNSARDCSISLKFGTEFEHVTSTTNVQGQGIKGQGHSLRTSSDRQIGALCQKIAAAESNGNVRIFIDSCDLYVCMLVGCVA